MSSNQYSYSETKHVIRRLMGRETATFANQLWFMDGEIDKFFFQKHTPRSAFTLIEIMIVVSIMAVIMAMSIPFARDVLHKEALNKAIDDVREVCESARTLAIMRGSMTEVVFHGKDGRFEVVGAGAGETKNTSGVKASGMSGQLADDLAFAALRINGVDILKLSEADVARVRFYPNGTCDELRLVLLRSSTGESRGLFLEITTGLVTIESDRWKLANEVR